jgi:hypothetical protein
MIILTNLKGLIIQKVALFVQIVVAVIVFSKLIKNSAFRFRDLLLFLQHAKVPYYSNCISW